MSYDALSLGVLCEELCQSLTGGKITKIYQPEKDEIVLLVFNGQTHKLVISANAGVNRIHITEMPTENPKVAPSFCMLLRKHITNAVLKKIVQMPYERVLDFFLTGSDDLGYFCETHLIFELTGKTSNIILTDGNYVVLDSIKHLPQDLDSKRLIMPGTKYHFFLPQQKIAPFDLPRIREWLCGEGSGLPLRKTLPEVLLGVSQATINEILCGLDENDHSAANHALVLERIAQYKENLKSKAPNVVFQKGTPIDVCPFDYRSVKGEKVFFDTLNKAHDYFYFAADKVQRFNDKAKSVSAVVKNAISRTEKKLAAQRQSVLEAENRETYKQYGDLILSNLWQIKQGAESFSCQNYFEENASAQTAERGFENETESIEPPTVTIPLDRQLSPQQNAQAYYKKYRKLKSSAEHNIRLVAENEKMLEYLLTIKQNLKFCTEPEDLGQIRDELAALGLTKDGRKAAENLRGGRNAKNTGKAAEATIKPLHYNVEGFDIYVGKNNVQNNYVTFKLARATDVWLHTQKIHSSHVVIAASTIGNVQDCGADSANIEEKPTWKFATETDTKFAADSNKECRREETDELTGIPQKVLITAAEICAYFSQASGGTKIPVDYTLRQYVKKPNHAALGFAVYNTYHTVLVDPNRHTEAEISH